ncbi:MAG: hypothetical protein K8T25_22115, partial [Planctomycetia bacterium]|nr:hypothetical protein [Planctomycetia bacterium]
CLAMVLCDHVHRDAVTHKHTILGTFTTFSAQEYPAPIHFCVYFAITDGQGSSDIAIRLVDSRHELAAEEVEPVFFVTGKIDFETPLAVVEGVLGVQTTLPSDGLYHCELLAGQKVLMSRRLIAMQAEAPETG